MARPAGPSYRETQRRCARRCCWLLGVLLLLGAVGYFTFMIADNQIYYDPCYLQVPVITLS